MRIQGKKPAELSELYQRNKFGSVRKAEQKFNGDGTLEGEAPYTDDQLEFLVAVDRYKRSRRRPFPTWTEVLAIVLSLGYRKVVEKTELPGQRVQSCAPPLVLSATSALSPASSPPQGGSASNDG